MAILLINGIRSHDQWVPVTTAWRVFRLRLEERSPIWSEAMNILNKQSRTAVKECSSNLGFVRLFAVKTCHITNYSQRPRTWNDPSVWSQQWKSDLRQRALYTNGLNTLRTGDADLHFYITTVQDGLRKSAFLTHACFPCTIELIMQYIEPVSEWSCWRMFVENWPHSELTFRHRASSI